METVQQNGRFTLFSSKFLSMYSILYGNKSCTKEVKLPFLNRKYLRGGFILTGGNTVCMFIIISFKLRNPLRILRLKERKNNNHSIIF